MQLDPRPGDLSHEPHLGGTGSPRLEAPGQIDIQYVHLEPLSGLQVALAELLDIALQIRQHRLARTAAIVALKVRIRELFRVTEMNFSVHLRCGLDQE
ncbi:hypothetical protein D3C78_1772340 [compost metagenome]